MIEKSNNISSEISCLRCKYIQQDIINAVKNTNEYKRSLAVSEAFNFLLDKLRVSEEKLMEQWNSEIKYTDSIKNLKSELNEKIKLTELNLEEFEQKEFILTNKIDALSTINKSLDSKVKQLECEILNLQKNKNENEKELEKIILDYKENFEKLGKEFQMLQNKLTKNEKESLDNEKKLNNEISLLKEKELYLNKKLKEFEVLIYKQNLENQNLRDSIRNFNNKSSVESLTDTLQSLKSTKIDVENELRTIDNTICKYLPTIKSDSNNYATENFLTINSNLSQDEYDLHKMKQTIESSPTDRNKNIENLTIEEIAIEIKKTESDLKNCSYSLKNQEISKENIFASNSSMGNDFNSDYKEFMLILEEKANYLFELKKRYNYLYKKLNTIN